MFVCIVYENFVTMTRYRFLYHSPLHCNHCAVTLASSRVKVKVKVKVKRPVTPVTLLWAWSYAQSVPRSSTNLTNHSRPRYTSSSSSCNSRLCHMARDAISTNRCGKWEWSWETSSMTDLPQLISSVRSSQVSFPSQTSSDDRHSPFRHAKSASEQLLFTTNKHRRAN